MANKQTAILAGVCFRGMQHLIHKLRGVSEMDTSSSTDLRWSEVVDVVRCGNVAPTDGFMRWYLEMVRRT